MLQAIIKKGVVRPEQIPAPSVSHGGILIKVINSCISTGTESSAVASSGKSLFRQAIEQPDKVKKALSMVVDKGLAAVFSKLKGKQEESKPTGYSVSGIVLAVGAGVTSIKTGDRVAAAGAGLAHHAEFVDVPENLVVSMPAGIDFSDASTVALGAIAMQGVRRADLRIGEYAVVVGAGMIGLFTLQILKASGIRTVIVDLDNRRLEIARTLGAELIINPAGCDAVGLVESWSGGFGADAVLFCAATGSNEPLSQAFKMCRRKGKVVLVGVSGMEINREDIYQKELDFLISTSYGPGRYDRTFEENGVDYPYAYVRWTEKRNMYEYLRLVSNGQIQVSPILEKTFPIERVSEAFDALANGTPKPLGVILDYGKNNKEGIIVPDVLRIATGTTAIDKSREVINIALVGCGGFARGTHLPNIQKLKDKYHIYAVVDKAGQIAKDVATQSGASYATTSFEQVIHDDKVDLVLIATRHDSHAFFSLQALQAGKNVFVEKPLAISFEQLQSIQNFYAISKSESPPVLMVGYNRRFSECAQKVKHAIHQRTSPLFIHYRMNAGYAPSNSWIHEDGGRIVGEACHIIDLLTYLTGSEIDSYACASLDPIDTKFSSSDNKSILLKYKDGSIGTIDYFSTGNKLLSKEYMEIHFDEKSIIMDDYTELKGYGLKPGNIINKGKGHLEELIRLHETLSGQKNDWPISLNDMVRTTELTLEIAAGDSHVK